MRHPYDFGWGIPLELACCVADVCLLCGHISQNPYGFMSKNDLRRIYFSTRSIESSIATHHCFAFVRQRWVLSVLALSSRLLQLGPVTLHSRNLSTLSVLALSSRLLQLFLLDVALDLQYAFSTRSIESSIATIAQIGIGCRLFRLSVLALSSRLLQLPMPNS